MFCTNCGRQLSGQEAFCPACGAPVSGLEPPPAASTITTGTQDEQFQKVEAPISSELRTVTQQTGEATASKIVDIERVIGKNSSYYLPEFEKYTQGEKTKFNWAAFFLGMFFCIYRKCWELVKKYYLLPMMFLILAMIAISIGMGLFSLPIIAVGATLFAVSSLWMLISCIRLGRSFNGKYYGHCQIALTAGNEKKYGTSVWFAILSVVVLSIILTAPNAISGLWMAREFYTPSESSNEEIASEEIVEEGHENGSIDQGSYEDEILTEIPSWCSGTYYGNDIYSTISFSDINPGLFDIQIYRLVDIKDCVITAQSEEKIDFIGDFSIDVGSVSGTLECYGQGDMTLTITESDWEMLSAGTTIDFYYNFQDPNYLDTSTEYEICGIYALPEIPANRIFIWESDDTVFISMMNRDTVISSASLASWEFERINDDLFCTTYTIGTEEEISLYYYWETETLDFGSESGDQSVFSSYGFKGTFFKQAL